MLFFTQIATFPSGRRPLRTLVGAVILAISAVGPSGCREETLAETAPPASSAVAVRVDAATGMTRGGQPYFVKGVGGARSLKQLAERGANSVRTWDTAGLAEILDEAESLGLTVSPGIWLEHECSWFSYQNPEHCAKQVERVRKEVMLYRDHPALLAWGIGNEVEGDGSNVAFWQQLDRLALLVKELDPAHPTFTAVAGMNRAKAEGMNAHAPNLDYVGVNTYGGIHVLRKQLAEIGWKRPWLLTEWGPRGFWESPKSASGAPIEQTSSEKAEMIRKAYQTQISNDGGCLGSYAFVWGWKFEATATWFGMFTHEGESTATADVLQEVWSSSQPANRSPGIKPVRGVPKSFVAKGSTFEASVDATDPDGDPLVFQWRVLPEHKGHPSNTLKTMPADVPGTIAESSEKRVIVTAPEKPGVYRLYVWIKDGKGSAATANAPFEVR